MREVVKSIPSRDAEAPFFGCLLSLGPQDSYVGSQWVGGNKLDDQVPFSAGAIFSGAAKGLHLSLAIDLDIFDFPLSGSNFSSYREVPYHVPVVAHMEVDGQEKEIVSWERAKELGCKDFSVRIVVLPISTKEVLVQVGGVPFSLAELEEQYSEVYKENFFPNTMLRVTRARTRLPDFMGAKTSSAAKSTSLAMKVDLVLEDTEGVGLGMLPFTTYTGPVPGEVKRPPIKEVKRALFNHTHAAARSVAKTAAQMPAALAIALKADKDPVNLLPQIWSPWPAFDTGAAAASQDEGMWPRLIWPSSRNAAGPGEGIPFE